MVKKIIPGSKELAQIVDKFVATDEELKEKLSNLPEGKVM